MSEMPAWYGQLQWSKPLRFQWLVAGTTPRSVIANGAGLYAFTSDDSALSPRNAVYIGKADGARQTLRSRLANYIRRCAKPGGPASGHAGLEKLCEYCVANPEALFVRWCGCILTREVEGGLIDLFDPEFNGKAERVGLADEERIPSDCLYEV